MDTLKSFANINEYSLPEGVEQYARHVIDLRWTWSHAADALWEKVDAEIWEQTENPYVVLQNLTQERLKELVNDDVFMKELRLLEIARNEYNSRPGWYGENYKDSELKRVVYISMEYGLGQALPLYAGGLGILSGDHLKTASDLGAPLIAIGLLYQEGYFRQVLDENGWQQEAYPYNDITNLPILPVKASSGAWLYVPINLPGRTVRLRVWQAQVGKITLYLLDSNDPLNSPFDRGITSKLYGGGQELRLVQEISLGIGGWRLINELNLEVDVCHLNEGHAAFATLERARDFMYKNNLSFWEAVWATRAGNVFTTHTPVTAGFDTYHPHLLEKYGLEFANSVEVSPEDLAALGRKNSHDTNEPFNMAFLAARTCLYVNGVSQLHGKISRHIFRDLYPRWPEQEIPIRHITNGVHVPSWDSPWADRIWTDTCGKARWLGTLEGLSCALDKVTDEELWAFRGQERADLINKVRTRLVKQLSQRGEKSEIVFHASDVLDPNILTLGFARRFAEYKRPNLLLHDWQRLSRLLTNTNQPVQIVIAGKAHPQDETGKRLTQEWIHFITSLPEVRRHAVFVEDYDIKLAQELVQGVDVWINTPRRPWEASGTSGMKILVNGGLNLSSLDGWWAEAFSKNVGWALGDGKEHTEPSWDAIEAKQLYRILEDEVVPEFYNRDASGIPRAWVARIRASMTQLAPQFSANRMVREYVEKLYLPAATAFHTRIKENCKLARELNHWQQILQHYWDEVRFGKIEVCEQPDGFSATVQVYLGGVSPEFVEVQLYADPIDDNHEHCICMTHIKNIPGTVNGFLYNADVATKRSPYDFTPRIIPYHPNAQIPMEVNQIRWM